MKSCNERAEEITNALVEKLDVDGQWRKVFDVIRHALAAQMEECALEVEHAAHDAEHFAWDSLAQFFRTMKGPRE